MALLATNGVVADVDDHGVLGDWDGVVIVSAEKIVADWLRDYAEVQPQGGATSLLNELKASGYAVVEIAATPMTPAGNPESRSWLRGWLSCLYAHGITPSPEILEATR